MSIAEIKAAVEAGQRVHWVHQGYEVVRDRLGQYLIVFTRTGDAIGLTDRSGMRLNGQEEAFFIAEAETGASA